ncbi:MAG: glycosyltransferase family 39 protein [Anaerolineae bacterium]|nr:glycosyltransferase family 39 protein [Anaerolineae bacterium]MDW8070449.1 glycosyltransferase family 39 protein [Anaerolineae bacterium]
MIAAWPDLLSNTNSIRTDQSDFLELGQDIRAGIRWTDGNRHPLLPLILSSFASPDWSYFTNAKLLNLGLAVVLLVSLVILLRGLFSFEIGILTAVLVAFNPEFQRAVVRVVAEPLLSIWFCLCFYFWYRGAAEPSDRPNTTRLQMFALSGVMAGLGYLTKGTAQLLPICFTFWWIISGQWRRDVLSLIAFLTFYFVTASPLLTYNALTWNNPFYNFSAEAMWADRWHDVSQNIPRARSISEYLATHSVSELATRFMNGGMKLLQKHWDTFLPLPSIIMLTAVAIAFSARFWIDCIRSGNISGRLRERILVVRLDLRSRWPQLCIVPAVLVPWLIFFAWYFPISNAPRHHVPLLALIASVVSLLIWHLALGVANDSYKLLLHLGVVILALSLIGYSFVSSLNELSHKFAIWNVYERDRQENRGVDELLLTLQSANPDAIVLNNEVIPSWHIGITSLRIRSIPRGCRSLEDLSRAIAKANANYFVVSPADVNPRPCLQQVLQVKNNHQLSIVRDMPYMRLMTTLRMGRDEIMVFERR